MKLRLLSFYIICLSWTLLSCNEQKNTSSSDEKVSEMNESNTAPSKSTESIPKVNPDGTVNATLNCEGKSSVSMISINGTEQKHENYTCNVVNGETLRITFSNEGEGAALTLHLFNAGTMSIETGEYGHMTKGNMPYATVNFKRKTEEKSLEIFDGSVTVIDYGMSSNVVCGAFNITDNEGNVFKGTFYEPVSSF